LTHVLIFLFSSSKIVQPACKIQFTSDPSCDRKTMVRVSSVQVLFHTGDPRVEATSSKNFKRVMDRSWNAAIGAPDAYCVETVTAFISAEPGAVLGGAAPCSILSRKCGPAARRPNNRRQAESLLQLHHEMEVCYCRLVTINTDNITQTNENRSGIGAH
jgi:hypothetical protein